MEALLGGGCSGRCGRQREGEGGACGGGVHVYGAAKPPDHAVGDGKAKAHALAHFAGGEEGVEDVGEVVWRDAVSGVGHGKDEVVAGCGGRGRRGG